jgi:hypothetical protein
MKGSVPVFVLLGLFGLLILLVAIGLNTKIEPSTAPAQAATARDDCKDNSFGYLLGLKEGDSLAAAYWKPGVQPTRLYNVRDFDEIGHNFLNHRDGKPYKNPRIFYEYEVQSSTQGGFAIRKRWDVVMERNSKNYAGQTCAIIELAEAE